MSYWFEYFPGNYMWSRGMLKAMELARFGAGAIGEVDQIGRRLKNCVGDQEAWHEAWSEMAERVEAYGDREMAEGRRMGAGAYYLRAATYHFIGERFIPPGPRKVEGYRKCLAVYEKGAAIRYPNMERVEIPYEGTTLPGRFMKAPGVTGPAPTMVFFDGLDDAKELTVLFGGVELAARGINTLSVDGPGQGEALRLRGIPSRYDYEVPATAAF